MQTYLADRSHFGSSLVKYQTSIPKFCCMLLYNVLRPYCPCIVVARRGSPWPVVRKVSVEWTLVRSSFEYLGVCPPLNHSSHCISGAFLLEREIDLDDLLEAGALELLRLAAPPSPPSTIAYDEIPLAGPIRPYLILIRDSEAGSFTAAKEEEISEFEDSQDSNFGVKNVDPIVQFSQTWLDQ